jgi:hypothetical protein
MAREPRRAEVPPHKHPGILQLAPRVGERVHETSRAS